jgi:outer membrane protein
MKKIILSVVAIMAFGFANAQDKKEASFGFAKGDIYLGGRVSYSSTTTDPGTPGSSSVKTTSTRLAPEVGYFISDNFALTLGLDSTSSDNGTTKPTALDINLGGRYYFLNMGERFKTFTNFGLTIGSADSGVTGADKTSTLGLGAGLGINYFVTPRLAIDFGLSRVLNYSSSKTGDAKSSGIELSINEYNNFFAAASFGLIYKL